ncbi:hypothetical protein AGMMS4956_21540 [Bacteroidia bacterium]|nr:hypothetical protein AGMMS4956_21540 [Bacteroidia bacterium]
MKHYKNFLCIALLCTATLSCKDGNKSLSLDCAALDALIVDSKVLLATSVEGEDINQYLIGSKDFFSSIVNESQYVRDNTDRQSAIDNYVAKLTTAKEVFLQSKVEAACPQFDGIASYIDCGPASQYLTSPAYTLELWAKAAPDSDEAILSGEGYDDVSKSWEGFIVRLGENTKPSARFTIVTAGNLFTDFESAAATFPANTWTHIAVTMSGLAAKLYINGIEVPTKVYISTAAKTGWTIQANYQGGYITKTPENLRIGKLGSFGGRHFKGKIYDVRIWDRVRTATEINQNYQHLLTGNETGLVANWQFDRKTGTNTLDKTGKFTAQLNDVVWGEFDNN